MKKGKLSDYYIEADKADLAFIWTPLLKAMAAGVKELEVTPGEFVIAMRSAIPANVYANASYGNENFPTILAMKITVV